MSTKLHGTFCDKIDLSPIGSFWIGLHIEKGILVRIELLANEKGYIPVPYGCQYGFWLKKLLSGMGLEKFPLPFKLRGTDFQKRIWHLTTTIRPGTTLSYGELAQLSCCNSPRAVGQALRRNPLPIIVPCHRVIGKDGKLTGFSGGIEIKRMLIQFERMMRNEDSSNE